MSAWPERSPQVGDRATLTRVVEPEDIERFTALSGDRNPLHHDPEVAARTGFGRILVQGA